MTRVMLAPDKFKGTLTAAEVAGHLADGIRSAAPATEIVTVPVSDAALSRWADVVAAATGTDRRRDPGAGAAGGAGFAAIALLGARPCPGARLAGQFRERGQL
jgi:glycerate kinase